MPTTAVTPDADQGQYPPIKRGASLLLAWRLEGKKVLLIGGGAVAASRLGFILESGAFVTLVSPAPLDPSIQHRVMTEGQYVTWHDRPYTVNDPELPVGDFDMVLTAVDDVELSRSVCEAARLARTPVNVADVPPECDFYFGAQVRRGPLQAMVSTSGAGPKIAVMVRDTIADAIPNNVEDAIDGVGALRSELRKRAPEVGGAMSKRRMRWMIGTCEAWSLAEMAHLKDPQVRGRLLDEGWENDKILGPSDLGLPSDCRKSHVYGEKTAWTTAMSGFVCGAVIASVFTTYFLRRQ